MLFPHQMLVPQATRTGLAFVPATGHRAETTVHVWYGLSWDTQHHRRRKPGDSRLNPKQPSQLDSPSYTMGPSSLYHSSTCTSAATQLSGATPHSTPLYQATTTTTTSPTCSASFSSSLRSPSSASRTRVRIGGPSTPFQHDPIHYPNPDPNRNPNPNPNQLAHKTMANDATSRMHMDNVKSTKSSGFRAQDGQVKQVSKVVGRWCHTLRTGRAGRGVVSETSK